MLNTINIIIISFSSLSQDPPWLVFKLKIPDIYIYIYIGRGVVQSIFLKSFLLKIYFLNFKDLSSDSLTNIDLMQAFKTPTLNNPHFILSLFTSLAFLFLSLFPLPRTHFPPPPQPYDGKYCYRPQGRELLFRL